MDGNQSCEWAKQPRLRKRPRRNYHCYLEEEGTDEGDMASVQYSYDILEKIRDKRFLSDDGVVLHFENGKNFSVQYLQTNGFTHPMIFHDSIGLDIKMPPSSFSVSDVKNLIGHSRMIDVMDCSSQEALTMRLDQFCKYYEDHALHKDKRQLNVISLEFSHTRLDPLVEAPKVVKELDWVNLVWPSDLIARQTDPTNDLRKMMYPKVQKYCLMSVAGCYTDFHLDFGGTSVWYHVLKGEKIFFLIPPSSTTYLRFEEWQKHGQQEKTFFPDLVENCTLVHLKEGDTLLLPSGWIHGVYTPKQSLVFGGNFLNSFHITGQLEVSVMEKKLKVHDKFCYPYYSQIHWYVVEKYSQCFTELVKSKEPDLKRSNQTDDYPYPPGKWVESVAIPKYPIDKFRFRPTDREEIVSPYVSPAERDGLNLLITRMKDGLFLSDAPGRIGNPRSFLLLLETHLHLTTLCSRQPNGVTLLGMLSLKDEDNKRNALAKQGDFEVINIIEEFFSTEVKEVENFQNVGGASQITIPPQINPKPVSSISDQNNNGHVNQLDHCSEHVSSKLIEELMQNTFGEKSQSTRVNRENIMSTSLNLLSEFTTDQVMQFLTAEQKSITQATDHMTPTSDHMTPISNCMTPNSDHMTPTNSIPSIPNIPNLTPDNMTNLLDQVSMLVLPGLNKGSSDDDSLSKIVSSSLDLLSPISSSTPALPFSTTFTNIPSTVTPTSSISSFPTPPSTLSLTNQIDRNLLSSINPGNSEASLFQVSASSCLHPSLVQTTSLAKPTSLPISPVSSSNNNIGGIPLVKPTIDPETKPNSTKEVKRRYSKLGGRKPRNGGSRISAKKPASRKSRCGKCDGCKRSPCGECKFCLDSVRMGGFGKLKKACIQRRCSNMVEPRSSSITLDSPNELSYADTLPLSKKELVKTIKTEELGHATSMTIDTPTLDGNPMIEVLSMGFAGNGGRGMETSSVEGLVLHPETFSLSVTDDLSTTGPLVADSAPSSNSQESPLMRLNDTFCQEDPLFNASSIPTIHAQVLSSPVSSQLSAADLFPFSSQSSMSESDFTLHLSEDNV